MPKTIVRVKRALELLTGLFNTPLAADQRSALEAVRGLLEEIVDSKGAGVEIRSRSGIPPVPHCRVLIAEDNQVNQRVACRLLQELGCKVDVSCDGVEALDLFNRETYDMIFLDCRMPRLDGYETIQEIRRREALSGKKRTPVVAMTAFALKGDRERCLKAGMDDYLPKPVMLRDLKKALDTWVPARAGKPPSTSIEVEDGMPSASPDHQTPPATLGAERIALLKRRPRGLLRELIDLFLLETPARLRELKQAVLERNLEAIEALAHQLKGSAGNLGAEKVAGLCERLEACVREGNLGRVPLLSSDLEREAGDACTALEQERSGLEKNPQDLR